MTTQKSLITLFVLATIVVAFGVFNNYIYEQKQPFASDDFKNAEFIIEGQRVKLGGETNYFGNELRTDLNADGEEDIVFLITQSKGGSGTFYYVVATLNTDRGYVGSEGLFLGDRIAPQTTQKGDGRIIVVNYADRAATDPFTTPPSIGKSIWLAFDVQSMQFGEVVQNFEGEANPDVMTLEMKKWEWISASYNDGREVMPKQPGKFSITFSNDGKFSATTDCNSMGGGYVAYNGTLTFNETFMTEMYCEGSQEAEFASMLETVSGYHFTSKGELILDLKFDSGSVLFK